MENSRESRYLPRNWRCRVLRLKTPVPEPGRHEAFSVRATALNPPTYCAARPLASAARASDILGSSALVVAALAQRGALSVARAYCAVGRAATPSSRVHETCFYRTQAFSIHESAACLSFPHARSFVVKPSCNRYKIYCHAAAALRCAPANAKLRARSARQRQHGKSRPCRRSVVRRAQGRDAADFVPLLRAATRPRLHAIVDFICAARSPDQAVLADRGLLVCSLLSAHGVRYMVASYGDSALWVVMRIRTSPK